MALLGVNSNILHNPQLSENFMAHVVNSKITNTSKLSLESSINTYYNAILIQLRKKGLTDCETNNFFGINLNNCLLGTEKLSEFIRSERTKNSSSELPLRHCVSEHHNKVDKNVLEIFPPSTSQFCKEIYKNGSLRENDISLNGVKGSNEKENLVYSEKYCISNKSKKCTNLSENFNSSNKKSSAVKSTNKLNFNDDLFLFLTDDNNIDDDDDDSLCSYLLNMSVVDADDDDLGELNQDENILGKELTNCINSPNLKENNINTVLTGELLTEGKSLSTVTNKEAEIERMTPELTKSEKIFCSPLCDVKTSEEDTEAKLEEEIEILFDGLVDSKTTEIRFLKQVASNSPKCFTDENFNDVYQSTVHEQKALTDEDKEKFVNREIITVESDELLEKETKSYKKPFTSTSEDENKENSVNQEIKTVESEDLLEDEVKSYKKPFTSTNEDENRDINDPNWEILKALQTDEERYAAVRKLWKNVVVPDPNENLTYHSYCRRHHHNVSASRLTKRSREEDDDVTAAPKRKRARHFDNLKFNENAINNTIATLTQNFYEERNKCFTRNLDLAHREYLQQLNSAKEEVGLVHKFYTGLPNQKVMTQSDIEEEHRDIEHIFSLFKRFYNWSGKVFNPKVNRKKH